MSYGAPSREQEAAQVNAEELIEEYGEEALAGGIVPTRCEEGCQVEPDGVCPHGCPSVLLEAGLI